MHSGVEIWNSKLQLGEWLILNISHSPKVIICFNMKRPQVDLSVQYDAIKNVTSNLMYFTLCVRPAHSSPCVRPERHHSSHHQRRAGRRLWESLWGDQRVSYQQRWNLPLLKLLFLPSCLSFWCVSVAAVQHPAAAVQHRVFIRKSLSKKKLTTYCNIHFWWQRYQVGPADKRPMVSVDQRCPETVLDLNVS